MLIIDIHCCTKPNESKVVIDLKGSSVTFVSLAMQSILRSRDVKVQQILHSINRLDLKAHGQLT